MNIPKEEFKEIFNSCQLESMSFSGKDIMITGGSGFLGSLFKSYFLFLNKYILDDPCFIYSVDCYTGRNKPEEEDGKYIKHIEHDICKPFQSGMLHGGTLDVIINAAGNASPKYYSQYSIETIKVSVDGTINICELAKDTRYYIQSMPYYKYSTPKVLNFSSSEVLGTPPDDCVPTDENYIPRIHTMNPRACYDLGKAYIEDISYIYKTKRDLDVKVVRLFNCVGRFRQDDFRVLPNYLSAAIKNEPIKVFGDGLQTRTFSYWTDVLAGCIKVLVRGQDLLYHIGNPNNEISMLDFAKLVEKTAGKSNLVKLVDVPDNYKFEPRRRCPSIEKARKELGYEPKVSVEEMVRRVFDWAVETYV